MTVDYTGLCHRPGWAFFVHRCLGNAPAQWLWLFWGPESMGELWRYTPGGARDDFRRFIASATHGQCARFGENLVMAVDVRILQSAAGGVPISPGTAAIALR